MKTFTYPRDEPKNKPTFPRLVQSDASHGSVIALQCSSTCGMVVGNGTDFWPLGKYLTGMSGWEPFYGKVVLDSGETE